MKPIRQQYHFRNSPKGLLAWDISKLCKLIEKLQIEPRKVKISEIKEFDECYWYDLGGNEPTCRNITEHMKLIREADLRYPIILDKSGKLMDGMHRVCLAYLKGQDSILAVQLKTEIQPDYIDVSPEDLDYD